MFNYFFTVEFNFDASKALQLYCHPILSFSNTRFNQLEATSQTFYSEEICTNAVLRESDELKKKLVGIDRHLEVEEMYMEAVVNPSIAKPKPRVELSDEEKEFWSENKLAVFAIYANQQAEDYIARFTIFCYEDTLSLEPYNPAFYHENFSTVLN
jgi:hypothetical protein